jgi:glycosyltransferase involved in cell wall biosynthesis
MQLSVIIPARNEEWLNKTVEEVLTKSRGETECIVILDGAWPEIGLNQHERLNVIYHSKSVGQRAAINEGARVSQAKYIMKLDAHCVLDEGFDLKLIATAEELGPNVTQIPRMYNLHVFDWVCADGHRRYQSPAGPCTECRKETVKDVVWKRRESRLTWAWRFDPELHFQYWHDYEKQHPEEYVETMSLLGACFFMERARYWELGGSDEAHGSWGQQGTEIACKTWLSGGRLICNKKTWFSHMFRTGGIGFPYPLSNADQEKARQYSRDFWRNNKFPQAIHDLAWIVDKFNPPGW